LWLAEKLANIALQVFFFKQDASPLLPVPPILLVPGHTAKMAKPLE